MLLVSTCDALVRAVSELCAKNTGSLIFGETTAEISEQTACSVISLIESFNINNAMLTSSK